VRLIEHRRAHNILIELSGIRKPFDEIKVGWLWWTLFPEPGGWPVGICQRDQACSLQSHWLACAPHAKLRPALGTTIPPALFQLQDALLRMDGTALSVEQLAVLSRAVPDDQERKDIELYLGGKHPKYK